MSELSPLQIPDKGLSNREEKLIKKFLKPAAHIQIIERPFDWAEDDSEGLGAPEAVENSPEESPQV